MPDWFLRRIRSLTADQDHGRIGRSDESFASITRGTIAEHREPVNAGRRLSCPDEIGYNETIVQQLTCGWIGAQVQWLSKRPLAALLSVVMSSSGCQYFAQRSAVPTNYNLPLTVLLRMDPSIGTGSVDYRDACSQAAALPVHEVLETQLKKRMGQVFDRVQVQSGTSSGVTDGVVDVALGLSQVNLFVPRKANKSYPATVTIGLDFSYTDQQGTLLHSKKLQSTNTGEVEARADTCAISGLDKVVQEAIATVVEGMAQQLGTATKIREQAQFKTAGRQAPGQSAPMPAGLAASADPALAPQAVAPQASQVPSPDLSPVPTASAPSGSTRLSFRTIIRDDNQNHVLCRQS